MMKNFCNFAYIYGFELKKLLRKKITLISIIICLIITHMPVLLPYFGNYYVDGKLIDKNYNIMKTDRAYARALSGSSIDQALLEKIIEAYKMVPITQDKHYIATEEYQKYARQYSEVFTFVRQSMGIKTEEMLNWLPDERDFYLKRQSFISSVWDELKLSQGEKDYWSAKEDDISRPFVYKAYIGYDIAFSFYQTAGVFIFLMVAICLSGVFTDEHTRRTDQIILCSSAGKSRLYWAKVAAGMSFTVISTAFILAITFLSTMMLYGSEGFDAAFQFIYTRSSENLTCGQAVLIAYGMMIAAAAFISVFVMVISEMLHSSMAALSVNAVMMIGSMMIQIPERHRILAQICGWLPFNITTIWNTFSYYTVSAFGIRLTSWQAAPIIYLMAGAAMAAVGNFLYRKYQVSGR